LPSLEDLEKLLKRNPTMKQKEKEPLLEEFRGKLAKLKKIYEELNTSITTCENEPNEQKYNDSLTDIKRNLRKVQPYHKIAEEIGIR